MKQPVVGLNAKPASDPTAVGDHIVAAQKLLAKITQEHAACLAAAERARAAATAIGPACTTASTASRNVSAFFVMQKLEPFRARVEAARKAEFAAAKAAAAAQRALLAQEVGCGLKKRKIETDEHDQNWKDWSHSDWARQETWTQNRRAVVLREGVQRRHKRTPLLSAFRLLNHVLLTILVQPDKA